MNSKEKVNSNCPTHLISDEPTKEDRFGSHEKVAFAIADLIRMEEGGKAIALTGQYGSGKSTVVELLRQKLDEKTKDRGKEIITLLYDAWLHQGDPLRRSLLEEIHSKLSQKELLLSPLKHKKKLDEICGKSLITTTTKTYKIITHGYFLLLSALLMPFALALIGMKHGMEENLISVNSAYFLLLLPILIVVCTYFWAGIVQFNNFVASRLKYKWAKKDENSEYIDFENNSIKHSLIWLPLAKIFSDKDNTHVSTTPDPTSIEFRSILNKILSDFFNKNSNHCFVIIIDNLDRLPPDQAAKTASTLRIFLSPESGNEDKWREKFWLLVPFDQKAMEHMWEEALSEEKVSKINKNNAERTNDFSHSFIQKTFQIVFRTPLPVTSDWGELLLGFLEEALPNHTKEDFEPIKKIYADLEPEKITPRQLIHFVNALGAIHRQWCGEIPLITQALYLLRGSLVREKKGAVFVIDSGNERYTEESRAENMIKKIDAEFRLNLIALDSNVTPKIAKQVILPGKFKIFLRSGNVEELLPYLDENYTNDILDEILRTDGIWTSEEPTSILNAAKVISQIKEKKQDDFDEVLADSLFRQARSIEKLPLLNEDIAENILLLAKLYPQNKDFHKKLLSLSSNIVDQLNGKEEDTDEKTVLQNITKGFSALFKDVNVLSTEVIDSSLNVNIHSDLYIPLLKKAREEGLTNLVTKLKPEKGTVGKIIEELCSIIAVEKGLDKDLFHAINDMTKMEIKWPWGTFIKELCVTIAENAKISQSYFDWAIKLFWHFYWSCGFKEHREIIKTTILSAKFFLYLNESKPTDAKAKAYALIYLVSEDIQPQALPDPQENEKSANEYNLLKVTFKNPPQQKEIQSSILGLFWDEKIINCIFDDKEKYFEKDLYSSLTWSILNQNFNKETIFNQIPLKLIAENYEKLSSNLEPNVLEKTISYQLNKEKFMEEFDEIDLSDLSEEFDLVVLDHVKCKFAKKVAPKYREFYFNYQNENWENTFTANIEMIFYQSLAAIHKIKPLNFDHRFGDEFYSFCEKLVKEKTDIDLDEKILIGMRSFMNETARFNFDAKIFELLIKRPENTLIIVSSFGEYMCRNKELFLENSTDLIDKAFPIFLKSDDLIFLRWTKDCLKKYWKNIVADEKNKLRYEGLKARIGTARQAEDLDNERSLILDDISEIVGLPPLPPKEEPKTPVDDSEDDEEESTDDENIAISSTEEE